MRLLLLGLLAWQALLRDREEPLLLSGLAALCTLAFLRKLWIERAQRGGRAGGEGGSAIRARERREPVLLSVGLLAWSLLPASDR